jgi:hypothetical protein
MLAASAFVAAFNAYTSADTFAVQVDSDTVLLFAKNAGADGNTLTFQEVGGNNADYNFADLQTGTSAATGYFSMGGSTG